MRGKVWIFGAALVAPLAAGCGNKGPDDAYKPQPVERIPVAAVTPGNEHTLMPLDSGNQWVYTVQAEGVSTGGRTISDSFELSWTVKDVSRAANGTRATIEIKRGDEVEDRQTWLITDKGIYQLSSGLPSRPFNPPQPIVQFPVKAGETFEWKGTGLTAFGFGSQTSRSKIHPSQEVDTDIGRLSAIPVESNSTAKSGKISGDSSSTVWFTPGVGIVRYRQEARPNGAQSLVLMKLKSRSLRKA